MSTDAITMSVPLETSGSTMPHCGHARSDASRPLYGAAHARQVASLLRLWLWASRPVQLGRLDPYLDEFAFRFDANLRFAAHDRASRFDAVLRLGWQLRPVPALRAVG